MSGSQPQDRSCSARSVCARTHARTRDDAEPLLPLPPFCPLSRRGEGLYCVRSISNNASLRERRGLMRAVHMPLVASLVWAAPGTARSTLDTAVVRSGDSPSADTLVLDLHVCLLSVLV